MTDGCPDSISDGTIVDSDNDGITDVDDVCPLCCRELQWIPR